MGKKIKHMTIVSLSVSHGIIKTELIWVFGVIDIELNYFKIISSVFCSEFFVLYHFKLILHKNDTSDSISLWN